MIQWNPKPIDDKNYLVAYKCSHNMYSNFHRAYWVEEEKQFISLENNNAHPIIADLWMEMPQPPCLKET